MRDRRRILDNLERCYRDELRRSTGAEDSDPARLDFEFQRDQVYLEVMLDVRDLLSGTPEDTKSGPSLLERAQQLRNLSRLR